MIAGALLGPEAQEAHGSAVWRPIASILLILGTRALGQNTWRVQIAGVGATRRGQDEFISCTVLFALTYVVFRLISLGG